jgi:CheY-like chemotaxis protein/signal transduction histidine kinase
MKPIVLACLLFLALSAKANMLSTYDHTQQIQSIWPSAHLLVDEQQRYQAQDIINHPPFSPSSPLSPPNLGFVQGNVWVWFTLPSTEHQPLQLQVGFPHLTEFSIHFFSQTGEHLQSMLNLSASAFMTRAIPNHFVDVALPVFREEVTVVLEIRSDHALRLPIDIGPLQAFSQQKIAQLGLIFLSIGMLLALCIYNFILFVSTSRPYYLFYCLNLFFLQAFFLIDLGFTRYFFDQPHWLNTTQSWAVSVCLAFIFAILFAKSFLKLDVKHPKWNRWFWVLIAGVIIDIMLVLIGLNAVATIFYLLMSTLYQVSVIVIATQVLIQGYKPARFFLLAWVFLAVGGFIYQLTIMGQVPVNLLTEHAFLIGTVIESILLSWALAELINKLQDDQIASERHYQNILNKTSKRLSNALKTADKHKKVRDVFLKNISHDLKTPLHSIQHVLDLSLQGYQVDSELMHDANHSTRLISRHIDKLLLNTEMGASDPDFKIEQVNIKPTLKLWHQDLVSECKARGTEFSINSNLADWDVLAGPVRPVYLLLTEIIFNASNLDINSIILNLDIEQDKGQLHLHLEMNDTSNTPLVAAYELFEIEQDGVFVNEVILLLGGHWHVQFEHPAIFSDVYLPFFAVSKKKRNDVLPERVLVVEDNEINQKVMRSMLTRMGIKCEVASNGEDALHQQEKKPFDIILMDCQMPIMDGFDTTIAIRANAQRYQNPVIIAVSANSMELDKTHCLSVGMNDFIAKPVRMADLRNALLGWKNTT